MLPGAGLALLLAWADYGLADAAQMVVPANNVNTFPLPSVSMALLRVIELPSSRWLTTLHPSLGAGFYSEFVGPLPFAFGIVPPERYYVVLIGRSEERGATSR